MKEQLRKLYNLIDALHTYALKGRDGLLASDEIIGVGVKIREINTELARLQASNAISDTLRRDVLTTIERVDVMSQSGAVVLEALLARIKKA